MEREFDRLSTALRTRYEVKEEIGRGAMATVYRAEDVKHGRDVAIKVLRPELVSGYEAERFFREIRTAARLTHPQILTVHDSGESGGFLYYVMPFVGCESLRDRLKRTRQLPLEEAIQITETLARALDYAHRQGVLHRDIKPENILLNEGQPLLTDFGIATAFRSTGSDRLTEPGLAVGTPAYMSPEQVTADRDLDGRSDLYSLACVAYEMLVGKPPFVGRSARATMALHAIEPAPPVRVERPEVPVAVEQALVRALAKEPDDRFASLLEFSDALTGSADLTVEPGAQLQSTSGARKIAVLPFENASPDPTNEYLSDGITDELIDALTKVNGLHVASRTSVFAYKGTRSDVRVIGAQLGVSAVLEGTVRRVENRLRVTARLTDVGDGRHLWSERYDRELKDIFAIQDEIAQTIVGTLRLHLLGTLGAVLPRHYTNNVRAYNLYLRGRYHWNLRTPEDIAQAIDYFQQAIDEDPNYALAYTGLSDAHAIQVDYRGLPVAQGMEQAKAEARKALELDETLAEAHTSLAWVNFIYEWDWAAADHEFRRAIELDSRYATAHQWYAWLHLALGRIDQALEEGRLAVELDAAAVSARRGLGWLHYYARQPESAIRHLQLALAIDPEAEETHRVLGLAYTQAGKYDAAEAVLSAAVRLSKESGLYSRATLGYLAAVSGDRRTAQEIASDLTREHHAGQYVSPVAIATVYLGLENFDGVFAALERAYEERRGWMAYLNVEPLLDPVRGDDRFRHLTKRMKFE